jgi:poly(3-hydroxybutyrate) depolymerase
MKKNYVFFDYKGYINYALSGALVDHNDPKQRLAEDANTFSFKENSMKVLMSVLLFSTMFLSQVQAKDSDLMLKKSFKASSGITLNYLLFVPKNYTASQKYPLVVTLHAAGSDYIYQVDNNDQAHPWIEDSVQAHWPNFIMAPGLPSGSSSWGGMMGAGTSMSPECKAVIEAVEDLKKTYSLDTNHFIIGGFSIGGAGTYHMVQFLPNYWSAACPVAAGGNADSIEIFTKTPIWHHQGSSDQGGAALIRMSDSLESHHYPVLRITCDMVLDANAGDGPAQWQKLIQSGAKPEDIIYKNAKPSYDSVSKAVDAGAKFIYQLITGADHEDSRINANHNPLLAKWAFSKIRAGATAIAPLVPVFSKRSETTPSQYGTFLTIVRPADFTPGPMFTLLGRTCRGDDAKGNLGAQAIVAKRVPAGNSGRQQSAAQNP